MGTPRCDCIAAVINNQLMVVGGFTLSKFLNAKTDSVEFASIIHPKSQSTKKN
jgi:hypothetical protein